MSSISVRDGLPSAHLTVAELLTVVPPSYIPLLLVFDTLSPIPLAQDEISALPIPPPAVVQFLQRNLSSATTSGALSLSWIRGRQRLPLVVLELWEEWTAVVSTLRIWTKCIGDLDYLGHPTADLLRSLPWGSKLQLNPQKPPVEIHQLARFVGKHWLNGDCLDILGGLMVKQLGQGQMDSRFFFLETGQLHSLLLDFMDNSKTRRTAWAAKLNGRPYGGFWNTRRTHWFVFVVHGSLISIGDPNQQGPVVRPDEQFIEAVAWLHSTYSLPKLKIIPIHVIPYSVQDFSKDSWSCGPLAYDALYCYVQRLLGLVPKDLVGTTGPERGAHRLALLDQLLQHGTIRDLSGSIVELLDMSNEPKAPRNRTSRPQLPPSSPLSSPSASRPTSAKPDHQQGPVSKKNVKPSPVKSSEEDAPLRRINKSQATKTLQTYRDGLPEQLARQREKALDNLAIVQAQVATLTDQVAALDPFDNVMVEIDRRRGILEEAQRAGEYCDS
ncbi:hypothetical protein DFH06DRAFT_1313285 [Mycena polygramma]|nr:hypothetical protein DFH06DRAFT_1313285 [Mycena polygramma]